MGLIIIGIGPGGRGGEGGPYTAQSNLDKEAFGIVFVVCPASILA